MQKIRTSFALLKRTLFLALLEIRTSFFFLLFSFCLIGSIVFSLSFFQSIFLCFLVILFWKVFLGLSWFNFASLLLALFEANILILFAKPLWVVGFVLIFLCLFWKKLFSSEAPPAGRGKARNQGSASRASRFLFSSEARKQGSASGASRFLFSTRQGCSLSKESYWREFLFYYLFLFWIIISYGFYFFLNYPFLFGFLFYALGFIIFSYFYFLFTNVLSPDFLLPFFVLALINLEFFLLLSYLSLSTLILSILAILVFRLVVYYYACFYEDKFFPTLLL